MNDRWILWLIFAVAVVAMLAVDLWLTGRRGRKQSVKNALLWCAFWIGLALAFNLLILYWKGPQTALEFLTAYLIEESLSVDNLFVFLLIFSYFTVPAQYQRKALLWGIVGVVIMRGIFIYTGITIIQKFGWMAYVLGAFLLFTGINMLFQKDKKIEPEKNLALKVLRFFIPISAGYSGDRFFTRDAGRLMATPLLIVVLVIETTDVVFAVDSIPAVLGVTIDPLVVYTSNIFAVMGLRSLFFALSGFMKLFHYLHYGLSAILAFIGVKMLVGGIYEMPIGIALGVVGGILALSVAASLIWPKRSQGD